MAYTSCHTCLLNENWTARSKTAIQHIIFMSLYPARFSTFSLMNLTEEIKFSLHNAMINASYATKMHHHNINEHIKVATKLPLVAIIPQLFETKSLLIYALIYAQQIQHHSLKCISNCLTAGFCMDLLAELEQLRTILDRAPEENNNEIEHSPRTICHYELWFRFTNFKICGTTTARSLVCINKFFQVSRGPTAPATSIRHRLERFRVSVYLMIDKGLKLGLGLGLGVSVRVMVKVSYCSLFSFVSY